MKPSLLSLSSELLALVVTAAAAIAQAEVIDSTANLSRATMLGALRMTCSRLSAAATPIFYRSVTLRPEPASIARWHAILDEPAAAATAAGGGVRDLVREAVIESEFESQDHHFGWGTGEPEVTELTEEWRAAVRRLGEFANLDAVYVRFSPDCSITDEQHEDYDDAEWYRDFRGSDTMEQRHDILTSVFDAMAAVNSNDNDKVSDDTTTTTTSRRRIRSLSIENLQNVIDTKLAATPAFTQVITGLGELHVSVCSEYDEAAPENSLAMPAVVKFWPAFTETWLRPAAPSLSSLTIYADTYFGAVPFWHGGEGGRRAFTTSRHTSATKTAWPTRADAVVFPNLRSFALGNYVLAYESQVAWLAGSDNFPRLESLMLDDCPIMSHMLIDKGLEQHLPAVYDEDLDTVHKVVYEGGQYTEPELLLKSRIKWDMVFTRLREGLPTLKHFKFTRGNWLKGSAFSDRDSNVSRFLARRYIAYNDGIGPSQFVEPRLCPNQVEGLPAQYCYELYTADYPGIEKIEPDTINVELGPPSNDLETHKAERVAFNRLYKALAQRQ